MVQWLRICLLLQKMQVQPLGQEGPLEKQMATHSSILSWRIPWMEEPGGLQSTGLQRVDEARARDGVSREVPCSALKGETVPDSLPATPQSSPTPRVPPRGTPRVPAPLPLSPLSPPDRDRRGDSPAWSGRPNPTHILQNEFYPRYNIRKVISQTWKEIQILFF